MVRAVDAALTGAIGHTVEADRRVVVEEVARGAAGAVGRASAVAALARRVTGLTGTGNKCVANGGARGACVHTITALTSRVDCRAGLAVTVGVDEVVCVTLGASGGVAGLASGPVRGTAVDRSAGRVACGSRQRRPRGTLRAGRGVTSLAVGAKETRAR